jgi:diguanylate cyclase (GGDEF)-like protein
MDTFAGTSKSVRGLLLLLLLTASPVPAQPAPSPEPNRSTSIEQAEWGLVRPVPVVTLQIRRVVGFLLLVPAFTMFLLYMFRPRPYVLAGVLTWVATSAMLLTLSFDSGAHASDTPDRLVAGRLGIAGWAFSAILFGAGVRFGGTWFRAERTIPRGLTATAVVFAAWVAIAVTFSRPGAVLIPAFVIMCVWQTKGALAYLQVAKTERFVGALLCSAGAFGIVIVNNTAAAVAIASGGIGQASTTVSYFNFLSASLLMLGMHLLIFEDVIQELRTAVAELARGRDEMKAMAVTDPLTRCYNRRFLDEIAHHELQQHRRYGLPLSILYVDIDHFKAINDTRGHQTGDTVLQTVGTILRAQTRQADYVFRWGGDEFLVLLSADETLARAKAVEIRQAFLASPIVRGLPDGVDVSIGCVPVPPETENFAPLIDQADREMYRRKRALAS